MVFDEHASQAARLPRSHTGNHRSLRDAKRPRDCTIDRDLSLEDLVMDVRSAARPAPTPRPAKAPSSKAAPRKRSAQPSRYRAKTIVVALSLGAVALVGATLARLAFFSGGPNTSDDAPPSGLASSDASTKKTARGRNTVEIKTVSQGPVDEEFHTIFDGTSGKGWILCDNFKRPVPSANIQRDGLNPRSSGAYLVVYDEKLGDFELDFDYKLARRCNSGVFLRVSDLNDPIHTGIEVAIDDTTGSGMHDTGAFYDLVAPRENAQKPLGQWNHMTITARGPKISVVLNEKKVSSIDLDEWNDPGKRPDGSSHKFGSVAIGKLARSGYVGFQDHGDDCWFNRIRMRKLSAIDQSSTSLAQGGASQPAAPKRPSSRFPGHAAWPRRERKPMPSPCTERRWSSGPRTPSS